MIKGENFLVFAEEWGFYPTTTLHLLRGLTSSNRFLWVHMLGSRPIQLSSYDLRRGWGKIRQWMGTGERKPAPKNVISYSPISLPFGTNRPTRWGNRQIVASGVRRRLRELKLEQPIFFATLAQSAEVVGSFKEKLVVYLCLDEYAEMPGFYREYIREMEEKMIARADLVLATSKDLALRKSRPDAPAVFLPQAVDFEHFSQFRNKTVPPPDDLAHIPRPRIGFVGLVADWIDLDLLVDIARAYPKSSVVVIGPKRTNLERLEGQGNIYVLGPRPYQMVPRYIAHFDVALIPFLQTELTQYVNPLKLLEYMAAGLPVVSTAMPDVRAYGDLVYCADSQEEFVEQVGRALTSDSPEQAAQRMEVARANGWEQRTTELSQHIEAVMQRKGIQ